MKIKVIINGKTCNDKKNEQRARKSLQDAPKRQALKDVIMSKESSIEERFSASLKLASLRRDGSKSRIRNRCKLTGRPRDIIVSSKCLGFALRSLANQGMMPGVVKS